MYKSKEKIFVALSMIFLLAACSEEATERMNDKQNKAISFEFSTIDDNSLITRSNESKPQTIEVLDSTGASLCITSSVVEGISLPQTPSCDNLYPSPFCSDTRGTAITTSTLSTVGITAYDHTAAFGGSTATETDGYQFANQQFTVLSQVGTSSPVKYWPVATHYLSFFAYAPAAAVSVAHKTGFPSFTYTVPTTLADQKDLLVSTLLDQVNTVTTDGVQGRAEMTFNHALSAVIFAFGDIGVNSASGSVTVTISGVYKTGTYTYSSTGGVWSDQQTTESFSTTASNAFNADYSTTASSGVVMFMLPQEIPADATLSISYTDPQGFAHSFSETLKNVGSITEWKPGHTYKYTIGTQAELTLTVAYQQWDNSGTPVNGPVTEYSVGEAFGLFAVDPITNKVVLSNVKMQTKSDKVTLEKASGTTAYLHPSYRY